MRFNLFALTTALLTAGSAHGAPEMSKRTSPTDVTGTLAELTSTVGDVNAVVTQINALSAVFVTPIAIEALGGLISEIGLASVSLNLAGGSLPLPSATDQTAICTSLGTVSLLLLLLRCCPRFFLLPPPFQKTRNLEQRLLIHGLDL